MNKFLTTSAALLLTTTAAHAGGLDRSGQSITALFETGTYAELSFGSIMPSVDGVFMGAVDSGNVAPNYTQIGFAMKTDLNDQLSIALITDQPFGADVAYTQAGYPLNGTNAQVNSFGLTVVGRYKINPAVSVHAGVRSLTANGNITITAPSPYASTYSTGTGAGYVVGAAYEKPEIALRVALTYSSAIDLALDGTAGDLTVTLPQSVNLDFQTGIAANTLLFGSIRWAEWTDTVLLDSLAGVLVDYDNDVYTYTLGVGRKFSDTLSGAVTFGYEDSKGGLASNLTPTDGYFSVGLGGTYTMADNVKLTGGVRYVMPGDATTATIGSNFSDNSAIAVGVKIGYTF